MVKGSCYRSCQPHHGCRQMDGPQKVASSLVIACGNGAVLLQACEEVFDQMPSLVEVAVIFTVLLVCHPRRNNHCLAFVQQRLNQPGLRVVGLVGKDGLCGCVLEQDIGALQVVRLPGREEKACRVAQGIDCGVDLGAQAASATTEGLLFWIPPFAPALCWWARTMVASIITYSLSASCAKASNTRCHTPLLLQREWRVCTTRKSSKRSGRSHQGIPAL